MAYLCRRISQKECDCCMACVQGEEDAVCPYCGSRGCETFYLRDGVILGCEDCIRTRDAVP